MLFTAVFLFLAFHVLILKTYEELKVMQLSMRVNYVCIVLYGTKGCL
jgi:hypothetical protein